MLFYLVFYGSIKTIGNFIIFLDERRKKLKNFYKIKKKIDEILFRLLRIYENYR